MPSKCNLTTEQRRRGGWTRARQLAESRRAQPSHAEQTVREFTGNLLSSLAPNLAICYEHEITHSNGQPQFLDIAIVQSNIVLFAIEIDGSRDWHNPCYPSSKMYELDRKKEKWCQENNISLLSVNYYDDWKSQIKSFLHDSLRLLSANAI